jgi:uncharacterized protein (AIM24 family)
MKITLTEHPTSALATIELSPGERLLTEPGTLRALSPSLQTTTWLGRRYTPNRSWFGRAFDLLRGFASAVVNWLWRAERAFFRVYEASSQAGRVVLAPLFPGMISSHTLAGRGLWFHSSAFLACGERVRVSPGRGPLHRADGAGELLLCGFGSIEALDIAGRFSSDVERVVAIDPALHFQVSHQAEGARVEFFGHGRLWVQSGRPSAALEATP